MIELNKIMNETLKDLEKEGYVEKIIRQQLEKTIKDIINDTFREYSDFGKQLEEYIKNNININFDKLGIEEYNMLILTVLKEQLDKIVTIQGVEKMKETAENMLLNVKEEYKLSDIIDKLKDDDCKEKYEYDEDDRIELYINKNGSYTHIYLDSEEKSSEYSCDYQIDIDKNGKPYSIKIRGSEINTKKILGGLWGLDKLLFKIYAHGSKVILDCGDDPEDYDLQYFEGY